MADTIKVMFLFYVLSNASTRTSFGFCSWSELLQLKFGEKKTIQGKENCSAPKTVMTKVPNERYLPYLQLFGKAFFVNFMY